MFVSKMQKKSTDIYFAITNIPVHIPWSYVTNVSETK